MNKAGARRVPRLNNATVPSLGRHDLKELETDLNARQRHEGQVTTEDALLDGAEVRFVGLDIHVAVLRLPDPFPVAIDYHLAEPVGNSPLGLGLLVAVWLRAWRIGHCQEPLRNSHAVKDRPGHRLRTMNNTKAMMARTSTIVVSRPWDT